MDYPLGNDVEVKLSIDELKSRVNNQASCVILRSNGNEIEEDFIAEMHKNLLLAFGDKETYDYMIGNKRWQELVNGNTDIR